MEKALGKWLMDVAKYIATAVIISSVFGEVDYISMYIFGSISVIITLIMGLLLVSDKQLISKIIKKK